MDCHGPPIGEWQRCFQTPAISVSQRQIQSFSISQTELDAALMKDRHQTIVTH